MTCSYSLPLAVATRSTVTPFLLRLLPTVASRSPMLAEKSAKERPLLRASSSRGRMPAENKIMSVSRCEPSAKFIR